jgi:hypothetical protein
MVMSNIKKQGLLFKDIRGAAIRIEIILFRLFPSRTSSLLCRAKFNECHMLDVEWPRGRERPASKFIEDVHSREGG